MKLYACTLLLVGLSICKGLSQIGGNSVFQFLNLAQSARTTALGGTQITTVDNDISLGIQSPSLLNESMHTSLSINHNFHLADITYGFSAFGYHFSKIGLSTMIGATYLDYGEFKRTDELGNILGNFGGKDVALILGASRKLNERMNLGSTLKWIRSTIDIFSSNGISLDLGLTYQNPDNLTITTFVIRNLGLQFSSFYENREPFPFDVQIGTSRKLKYLPLRLSVVIHDLHKWNLRTDRPDDNDPLFIDQTPSNSSPLLNGIDNFFHHVIIGGEFLIGKNEVFKLRFGYNHQLKKELKVSPFRSLNGFSFGFGFKVKKIAFDYGFGSYHIAGGMNHLSLSTNIQEWSKI